jgi:hypothetical protein
MRRVREEEHDLRAQIDLKDAQIAELQEALEAVEGEVCSWLCPSQWRTEDGRPPHSVKCQALRTALARVGSNKTQKPQS